MTTFFQVSRDEFWCARSGSDMDLARSGARGPHLPLSSPLGEADTASPRYRKFYKSLRGMYVIDMEGGNDKVSRWIQKRYVKRPI